MNGPSVTSTRQFIIYAPPEFPNLDVPAQRALHHYRARTASAIAYPFGYELWSTIAIQMSEKHDFVMSALIALSSMHELYFQPPDVRSSLQQDGIRHYNKAIRDIVHLNQVERSTDAILISCIAFCALESLRGSWPRALQHALSGMKIIAEQRQSSSQESSIPAQILDEAFLALQNQVMELGGRDESRVYRPFNGHEPDLPLRFDTVEEALHHLQVIYNCTAYLLDCHRLEQGCGDIYLGGLSMDLEQQHALIKARLEQWGSAMENLRSSGNENPHSKQRQACLLLDMYYVGFQTEFDDSAEDSIHKFTTMLDLAETFLKCQAQGTEVGSCTYSVSLGVIPVLFMLATQDIICLREKSLSLLRLHKRREGPWDSGVAARLAERVIATKTEMVMSRNEQCSVSVLEINFVDDTTCQITYIIKVQQTDAQVITWPATASENCRTYIQIIDI